MTKPAARSERAPRAHRANSSAHPRRPGHSSAHAVGPGRWTWPRRLACALLALLAFGCWPATVVPVSVRYVDPGAEELRPVALAVARLHPVGDGEVEGVVAFSARWERADAERDLLVEAQVSGLPGDRHAFHVHLFGDCRGDDGSLAGTHFNFEGSSREPRADIERITGNLGELVPGPDGRAAFSGRLATARLHGPYSILGRAVIVHARGNDLAAAPIGDTGPRIACGVIGIADEDAAPTSDLREH